MHRIPFPNRWGVFLTFFALFGCYQSIDIDATDRHSSNDRYYIVGDVPTITNYSGVDLLLVVDNSSSMAQEQQILANSIFQLINKLTRPVPHDSWPYSPIVNMRFAVVTSDMGLQFGTDRQIDQSAGSIDSCVDERGDDGAFMDFRPDAIIEFPDNTIPCALDGGQCPPWFNCVNSHCVSMLQSNADCSSMVPSVQGHTTYLPSDFSSNFATQAACLSQQGTVGCGVEQQLEAAVRGIERQRSFLVPDHVLAVLVVSDEEDCSIKDPALFSTKEWDNGAGRLLNAACNINGNEQYLMPTSEYRQRLAALKGDVYGVVFGAVVGVPKIEECQGNGYHIGDCLNHPSMTQTLGEFRTDEGDKYTHFHPACTRTEQGIDITTATPGRRYVQVAKTFGISGIVYSICNKNWEPAVTAIAEAVATSFTPQSCFHSSIPLTTGACETCVEPYDNCHMYVEIPASGDQLSASHCPAALYGELSSSERNDYLSLAHIDTENGASALYCAIPKLSVPRECVDAIKYAETEYAKRVGFFYCENTQGCDQEIRLTPKGWAVSTAKRRMIKCERTENE